MDDTTYPQGWSSELVELLTAPFAGDEIGFLPRGSSNGKAKALPYIDSRAGMARLDDVVGPGNWSFDWEPVGPKAVKGKLTVFGVTKCDAGEATDEAEVFKSAVSDAFKRCAVQFGIGRYLYYVGGIWCQYDSQKRRFTETPKLNPDSIAAAVNRARGLPAGMPNTGDSTPRGVTSRPASGTNGTAKAPQNSGSRATGTSARPTAPPPASAPNGPHCESCRKPMTALQVGVSEKICDGRMFCPDHQREYLGAGKNSQNGTAAARH